MKPRSAQPRGLKAAGELDRVGGEGFQRGALAPDRRAGLEGLAGGRVEGEVGAVGVHAQVAQAQRDALEDVGDRVRALAVDFGAVADRVEAQRLADDDGAGVEGPGDRRGDRHHAERVPVVGAGEVEAAVDVGELGADARAGDGAPDLAGGRAGGVALLFGSPMRPLARLGPGDALL